MANSPQTPGPDQESVWDYPRPPRAERSTDHVRIVIGDKVIADSQRAMRVLETSHPPVYYFPPDDVAMDHLSLSRRHTFCEWKGLAKYYDLILPDVRISEAAWFYDNPSSAFAAIEDYVAFYPAKMEACFVNDERVCAQEGDFYGGWITSKIVGPFKGGPGTRGW